MWISFLSCTLTNLVYVIWFCYLFKALLLGLFGLSRSVLMSSVFYLQLRSGIAARAAALSFIYQKLSRLKSVGNKSVGEVRLPI